jgi:hypothetical protein
MTKDDDDTLCYRSELEAAVKAAVEAEREACAQTARTAMLGVDWVLTERVLKAIRKRGEKE